MYVCLGTGHRYRAIAVFQAFVTHEPTSLDLPEEAAWLTVALTGALFMEPMAFPHAWEWPAGLAVLRARGGSFAEDL